MCFFVTSVSLGSNLHCVKWYGIDHIKMGEFTHAVGPYKREKNLVLASCKRAGCAEHSQHRLVNKPIPGECSQTPWCGMPNEAKKDICHILLSKDFHTQDPFFVMKVFLLDRVLL